MSSQVKLMLVSSWLKLFRDQAIKGNDKTILIMARKRRTNMDWKYVLETKGLTPIKKSTLSMTSYAATQVLEISVPDSSQSKMLKAASFFGNLMRAVE